MTRSRLLRPGPILSFLGLIWAVPGVVPVARDVVVLGRADAYEPATLHVTALDDERSPSSGHVSWWIEGTLEPGGQQERVAAGPWLGLSTSQLGMFTVSPPESREEAETLIPVGSALPVLHDPDGSRTSYGGVTPGILPAVDDVGAHYGGLLWGEDLPVAFGPLALGLVVWWVGARRRQPA